MLIKNDQFLDGSESNAYFGNCATTSPSASLSPSSSSMPSSVPSSMPSSVPSSIPSALDSESPSLIPTTFFSSVPTLSPTLPDPCPADQDLFEMTMQPDSTLPGDVKYELYRRRKGVFSRLLHQVSGYTTSDPTTDSVCVNDILCMIVIVTSNDGQGIGDGSFSATYNGK